MMVSYKKILCKEQIQGRINNRENRSLLGEENVSTINEEALGNFFFMCNKMQSQNCM